MKCNKLFHVPREDLVGFAEILYGVLMPVFRRVSNEFDNDGEWDGPGKLAGDRSIFQFMRYLRARKIRKKKLLTQRSFSLSPRYE